MLASWDELVNTYRLDIAYNYLTSSSGTHKTLSDVLKDSALKSATQIIVANDITKIGDYSLSYCSNLISITLPNSITSIGVHAFAGCTSLVSINIPFNTTTIDEGAFWYCSQLKSIIIPNSLTSISQNTFAGCSALTSIEIPNTITTINNNAFFACDNLNGVYFTGAKQEWTDIYIDYGNGSISNTIIHFNTVLGVNTTIPSEYMDFTVTSTNRAIIGYTTSTTELAIPSEFVGDGSYGTYAGQKYKVSHIESGAFNKCSSLISLTIPSGVTTIGKEAFYQCSLLTSVTISNSVTSIGNRAFSQCTSLASIEIPSGVTKIDDDAFSFCSALTTIQIPSSVMYIGKGVFKGCSNLNTIIVDERNPNYCDIDGVLFTQDKTILVTYPANKATTYSIPQGTKTINDNAFSNCTALTSITLPDDMEKIGSYAFSGCSSLSTIKLPNSVQQIGIGAFYWCNALTSIKIPNGVMSIPQYMLANCESLECVTILGATHIGECAFRGCDALNKVNYFGSTTQWKTLKSSSGDNNDYLWNATITYNYSA